MHGAERLRIKGLGQAGQALGQDSQASLRLSGRGANAISGHGLLQAGRPLSIQAATGYHGA
jgi:hypothetical protein